MIASTAMPGMSASTLTPFITNVTGAERWSTNHAHTSRSASPGAPRSATWSTTAAWATSSSDVAPAPTSTGVRTSVGTSLPSAVRRVASTTVANSAHTATTDQAILSPMSANHMRTS